MTDPEKDPQYKDERGSCKNLPGNPAALLIEEILPAGADVFRAWHLKVGQFLDLHRGCGLRRSRLGLNLLRLRCMGFRSVTASSGSRRLPDLLRIDLRLAESSQIVANRLLCVQSEMLGVSADESFVKDATGKVVEVFLFDSAKHARADLGDIGNIVQREFFLLARVAKFVAEISQVALRATAPLR